MQRWRRLTQTESHTVLVLRVSAILLLLYGTPTRELDVAIRVACFVPLVFPWTVRSPILWAYMSGGLLFLNGRRWYLIDNHQYLITYWTLVCALAVSSNTPETVLRVNARVLVAICFSFATLWKFCAGEYLDGSFLHYKMLTDDRLGAIANALAGDRAGAIESNRVLLDLVRLHPVPDLTVPLVSSEKIRRAALIASWWTLLLEGMIAVLFWARNGTVVARARETALLLFIATTYFVLPVRGFAFALTTMGLAQSSPTRPILQLLFIITLPLIELTRLPLMDMASLAISKLRVSSAA